MLECKRIHALITSSISKLGFALGLGVATASQPPVFASHLEAAQPSKGLVTVEATEASVPLSDGVYLYGQTAEPGQIGSEYLVFEVQQDRVVGATYLPRSEFSCFTGDINSQRMALSIVDPYSQAVYPYSVAIEESSSVAAAGSQIPHSVGLIGYQKVSEISDNDRRMLNVCLDNFR